ncbi:MAG: hypothetical protein E4H40_04995 [Candidatus Brocadiia bacterium]|nr:MAG: hypothetical protein E4H40_04995 [Candidatus Brocadiia bacterium]
MNNKSYRHIVVTTGVFFVTAGFGGSVRALTQALKAKEFAKQWSRLYNERIPDATERSQLIITRPGPAAFEVK